VGSDYLAKASVAQEQLAEEKAKHQADTVARVAPAGSASIGACTGGTLAHTCPNTGTATRAQDL